jgi:plasmid stabilization system protein ParE
MSERYRVIIYAEVFDQITAICDYIAKSSPQGAVGVVNRLLDAVHGLDLLPTGYKVIESRRDPNLTVRSMPVPPYIAYYRVNESQRVVRVLTVIHGARRQPKRFR